MQLARVIGTVVATVAFLSAKGAKYDSQGKREARRPWWRNQKLRSALKGRNTGGVYFGPSGLARLSHLWR